MEVFAMTTTDSPMTLDQALVLVERLSIGDQAQLVAALAPRIAKALASTTSTTASPSSARALMEMLPQVGIWAGDDLEERLADVYATRSPVTLI